MKLALAVSLLALFASATPVDPIHNLARLLEEHERAPNSEVRDLAPRDATGRCADGETVKSNGLTPTSNGCGPGKFGGALVPELWFNACCNKHDTCYATCSKSKATCDTSFLTCMKAACDTKFAGHPIKTAGCKELAGIYYSAVKTFGGSAFDGATEKYCTCV